MRAKPEYILPFERHEFGNGDLLPILKKLAAEKAVKVDAVITSSKADKLLKGVALVFCAALGILVAVQVALRVIP